MSDFEKHLPDALIVIMMEEVREICSCLSSIREKNNIRSRQPLSEATIFDPKGKYSYLAFAPRFVSIIKDEVNIKKLFLNTEEYRVEL